MGCSPLHWFWLVLDVKPVKCETNTLELVCLSPIFSKGEIIPF
jgi:hypothetical protein